jgi:hypothetical protein
MNSAYTWPPKGCPCGSNQSAECQENGCKWERDPSLVPAELRMNRRESDAALREAEARSSILRWGYGSFVRELARVSADAVGGPWVSSRSPTEAALLDSIARLQAMADEYQAWIDFYHRGEGDYADFMLKRAPK